MPGAPSKLRRRHVRSRLALLVAIPAVAVTILAFCVVGLADVLQGAQIHSPSGSGRDEAILSALAIVVVVVIVLATWLTIATTRSVLRPLYRLRARALQAASGRLPDAGPPVAGHRVGESVGEGAPSDLDSVDADSPDEIGDLARAFNQMRGELLRMAAKETALRGKLDAMLVNLSHRSQSQVERQIRLIENLEQGEQDGERRGSLSRMNRIATSMHRNAQNLLVLAGHELSSGWNQPVSLQNVIRAAVSEVEEWERISLHPQPDIAVSGPVVNDLVHLLAELTENATSFSAVDMPVNVSGYLINTGGALIDITDRGVGMSTKELAYANWRLENPPTSDIEVPRWIGLFVVARLAARHGIRIRLRQPEFGGLTALVWLPDEVLVHHAAAVPPRSGKPGSAVPRRGSHEAAGDVSRAVTERSAASELSPLREEARSVQLGRRLLADAGRQPDLAPSAVGARAMSQADPLVTARPSGLGSQASGGTGMPQFDSPVALTQQTGSAGSELIVSPIDGPAESGRLPIFDSVESHWFSRGREMLGSPGAAATAGEKFAWSTAADKGWRAAEIVEAPAAGPPTSAGLPRRMPNANLLPGAIPGEQAPAVPNRSAAAARDRLARFQRGVNKGRAVARETADSGEENDS